MSELSRLDNLLPDEALIHYEGGREADKAVERVRTSATLSAKLFLVKYPILSLLCVEIFISSQKSWALHQFSHIG